MAIENSNESLPNKGGRTSFSIDDPELAEPFFGFNTFEFGDKSDGPVAVAQVIPPDTKFAPHFHETDYCTIVLRGALKVGSRWYREGDCRFQDEKSVYGPVESGPEGARIISFYADRLGLPDQFAKESHEKMYEELLPIAVEACLKNGIGVNAPNPMEGGDATDTVPSP
jgi:hypothetical protein